MPFTDPGKIDQMLPYELEQSLPVPADDLIVDFIPVSHGMTGKKFNPGFGQLLRFASRPVSTRILAVAIEKSRLAAYLSCLKRPVLIRNA